MVWNFYTVTKNKTNFHELRYFFTTFETSAISRLLGNLVTTLNFLKKPRCCKRHTWSRYRRLWTSRMSSFAHLLHLWQKTQQQNILYYHRLQLTTFRIEQVLHFTEQWCSWEHQIRLNRKLCNISHIIKAKRNSYYGTMTKPCSCFLLSASRACRDVPYTL